MCLELSPGWRGSCLGGGPYTDLRIMRFFLLAPLDYCVNLNDRNCLDRLAMMDRKNGIGCRSGDISLDAMMNVKRLAVSGIMPFAMQYVTLHNNAEFLRWPQIRAFELD
jgi:hypothetical protein